MFGLTALAPAVRPAGPPSGRSTCRRCADDQFCSAWRMQMTETPESSITGTRQAYRLKRRAVADQGTYKPPPNDRQEVDDPGHKSVNQEQPPAQLRRLNQGRPSMAPRPEPDPVKKKGPSG